MPYSEIDSLEIQGQEVVAKNARGRVICRHFELETSRLMETFSEIDAGVARYDSSPTGFERNGARLEDWLAGIDARITAASAGPYRGQPWDWDHALATFRNPARPPEARAGAAWALLGSRDPMHRDAVLAAIDPSLPPLVLALCALRSSHGAAALLARERLAVLSRNDRKAWRRLARQRRYRVETPSRLRLEAPTVETTEAQAPDREAARHAARS